MGLNKNLALILVALTMTVAMWMIPETISAQSHKQRLLITTYNTNTVRTDSVIKFCAGKSRADLINTDDKATAESYKKALSSALNIQGNTFINNAINGDAMTQVTNSQSAFGVFIGFFAVGFIIILVQWMCLCCCCCCPSCCPSKCCQKDDNEQYSKCQLYWPSIFLVLLLLLIIIVSAIGLSKATTFKKGIADIQCSVSMFIDDVINGNVTSDGTAFFTGIDPLITSINNLNTNMGTIQTQLGNLDTGLTNVALHSNTTRDDIRLVPKNLAADGNAPITYKTNISSAFGTTTGTVDSLFVSILGSSGNGGIIGNFYSTMVTTASTLNGIKSGAASFVSGASGFSTSTSGMTGDLGKVKDQINSMDSSLKSFLDLMETPKDMGTLVINLIYGIMLGLSVLALLGVVLMTFCDKYKCRYLMYFSCVILFFLGLLGFLLAIIFSLIVPVLFLLCEWLDVTITSAGFATNTQKFVSDTQVQNILGSCLVGGDGNIMAAVGGASINTTINGLKDSITNTNTFNTSSQLSTMNTAVTNITDSINQFKNGQIPDVSDGDSIASLIAVSKTQDLGACAATSTDSFILSTVNTTLIPCQITGGTNVIPSGCTQANFESNTGCHGCIDSSLLFNAYYSTGLSQGQWKSKLDAKYGAGCPAAWTTLFGNVWDNYYQTKTQLMVPIATRWATAAAGVTQIGTDFTSVNTTMTNVMSTLNATFDSITNPSFGLIAGLNCRIIGQDLQLVVSSMCVSNFNTFYITRLLMGIAAFGILFAMCCIVCSGVRHFKHSERKDKVSPNFMGDKNSFQQTDAAFRP